MSAAERSCDPAQMTSLARHIADAARVGDCITLSGPLGAGKTTFARAFIRALAEEEIAVASPTYMLVQTYPVTLGSGPATLWHADLYRLRGPEELREIGLEEALADGVLLVEWPEMAEGVLPKDRLAIAMEYGTQESVRRLRFSCGGDWAERLKGMT